MFACKICCCKCLILMYCICSTLEQFFKANLVDDPPCNAANDVPNEEEARNPGPEKEVDLYWVSRCSPIHHLGDGHAREGQPAAHYGSSEGYADCS